MPATITKYKANHLAKLLLTGLQNFATQMPETIRAKKYKAANAGLLSNKRCFLKYWLSKTSEIIIITSEFFLFIIKN